MRSRLTGLLAACAAALIALALATLVRDVSLARHDAPAAGDGRDGRFDRSVVPRSAVNRRGSGGRFGAGAAGADEVGGALPSWVPADWADHIKSSAVGDQGAPADARANETAAPPKSEEELAAAAAAECVRGAARVRARAVAAAERRGRVALRARVLERVALSPRLAPTARARRYEQAIANEWLFAHSMRDAESAWKVRTRAGLFSRDARPRLTRALSASLSLGSLRARARSLPPAQRLAPMTGDQLETAPSDCKMRVLIRGSMNWTCVRIDGEQAFAPKPPIAPRDSAPTAREAAVCLVGQVHSLPKIEAAARALVSAFPRAEVFVYAHPTSTRPDGQVENWGLLGQNRQARERKGDHFADAASNVRATEAELRAPAVAGALRALRPAATGVFNATAYERVFAGEREQSNCFERPTPRGSVQKGDMPCCHFSHRGPYLWGAAQCFAMVRAHERRSGKRFRWVVRARPDYLPQVRRARVGSNDAPVPLSPTPLSPRSSRALPPSFWG